MTSSNKSNRKKEQNQNQFSICNRSTHSKEYPYLSDLSQLLHTMSTIQLQSLCTLQEMLLAKSFWEAANYGGSLERCKNRLTELYGENWDEYVKLKEHFTSLKYYYIWSLLLSHRQHWNENKK